MTPASAKKAAKKAAKPPTSIPADVFANLQRAADLEPKLLDPRTPPDVIVTLEPREPVTDPTLGIAVPDQPRDPLTHRLVTIGDSLTHGFQSGAIFNTDLSYPAIIAHEMGIAGRFRFPRYEGHGGLPLNIELLVRVLEQRFGAGIDWWELGLAAFTLRQHMSDVEDWWERGPGSRVPDFNEINHNLAVYGWDLRDTLDRTAQVCFDAIGRPKDQLLMQMVENANERTALRVLNFSPTHTARNALTPLGQAAQLGAQGTGIETLIVLLGANNALATVTRLKVEWSGPGFDTLQGKTAFTVWRPTHFESELRKLAAEIHNIQARHVIWGTVPHVTIAPVARGVDRKVREGSRYFPFYTRPWIADDDFDDKRDPHITEAEARAIDSTIDQYNWSIEEVVRAARRQGKSWLLLDVAGMLDRLAARRYITSPRARPAWWRKYELPPELKALEPEPDSRFFLADNHGRRLQGGLFSLDGVHPTTIAYGLLAQEFINVMQSAGVRFFLPDGRTERTGPVRIDFNRLIRHDTLIADPPRSLRSGLQLLGWIDEKIDVFGRLLRLGA